MSRALDEFPELCVAAYDVELDDLDGYCDAQGADVGAPLLEMLHARQQLSRIWSLRQRLAAQNSVATHGWCFTISLGAIKNYVDTLYKKLLFVTGYDYTSLQEAAVERQFAGRLTRFEARPADVSLERLVRHHVATAQSDAAYFRCPRSNNSRVAADVHDCVRKRQPRHVDELPKVTHH
ncbi:hypothetical protein HPB50_029129 [Hyalomma asiaticum]|nr:hypothetical protein HPB50_029129 [Hyalomma asiaticum]